MAFDSIVKRTVILVNAESGARENFTIAIGAPYRPAVASGMADHAACLVQVSEEIDAPGFEVYGIDELEALKNAIEYASTVFDKMASQGTVLTESEKPYSPKSASQYTRTLGVLLKRIISKKPKG